MEVIDFRPNWASSPGSTILDTLRGMELTVNDFTSKMKQDSNFIQKLIEGEVPISIGIAKQLSEIVGSTEDFWIARDLYYRQEIERLQAKEEQEWLKELPLKDMISFNWINEGKNLVEECLNFFGVSSIKLWREKYSHNIANYYYRTSQTFNSEFASMSAWLRQGEIIADEIKTDSWNVDLFSENLTKIKALTRKKSPKEFLPELEKLCAECGVSVAIVRSPTGCRASGATKFLDSNKAMILLSFRYLSDDHFWFTFFHEAGHLVMHTNKLVYIEDNIPKAYISDEEVEANTFAAEILIPHNLQSELSKIRGNKRKIISLAMQAGVSPGIVVGQLQHHGYADRKYLNGYKRRYKWDDII